MQLKELDNGLQIKLNYFYILLIFFNFSNF